MNEDVFERYAALHKRLMSAKTRYDCAAALNTLNRTPDQRWSDDLEFRIARLEVSKIEHEIAIFLVKEIETISERET